MNSGINNNTYIGNFRVQQSDNSTSPHQQMMNQMTDGFKPFYKKYDVNDWSNEICTANEWFFLPTVISSSATTCRLFENFSRNCPEIMFKSHFDEVIILQLFITYISCNPTTMRFLRRSPKTNSRSAMWNPFSQQTLFNAYRRRSNRMQSGRESSHDTSTWNEQFNKSFSRMETLFCYRRKIK